MSRLDRLKTIVESILGLVTAAFALLLAFGFGCGLIYHILLLFGAKAGMLIPRLLSTYGGYATLVGAIGVGSIMLTIGFHEIIVVVRKLATRKTDREIFSDSFLEEL